MRTLLIALVLPGALAAQPRFVLSPYGARNHSLPGTPTLLGLSLTSYSGVIGLRLGGAFDAGQLIDAASPATARAWTADADVVLAPSRLPLVGSLLAGFVPSVFSGIGAQALRDDSAPDIGGAVWSYGVNVSRSIGGSFGLESEARYRVPIELADLGNTEGQTKGWEYRLGFSIGFGGGGGRRRGILPGW